MRVLVGIVHQVHRPFPQVAHGLIGLTIVSGECAVDEIEPGLLFDTQDFPGAFETAAVNAAQYGIGFSAEQVPVDPKGKLILEVGDVVGGENLALAQGGLGIIHLDQARIGVSELRQSGQIGRGFHEAENFKALQTFIEAAFGRGKIVGVPAAPAGRFSIEIDQLSIVIDQMGGDPFEVCSGLGSFFTFRGEIQKEIHRIEVRA